jgi:fumarylacetoacetase
VALQESFIKVAEDSHFPIQNLPYGAFSRDGGSPHIGVAIGDLILDLTVLQQKGLIGGDYFQSPTLNLFMREGRLEWQKVRRTLRQLLDKECQTLQSDDALRKELFCRQSDVRLTLPIEIGDYTDFYSSKEHATNVGTMFRDPNNALLPNWLHVPVAYHGRASSVVISGTDVRRPCGQTKADDKELPSFGPCRLMDYELELGLVIGRENRLGEPIPVREAHDYIFGMVLVNDWSARDIQKWEYVPLGPFLAKNLATSISPWIVTMEALEEFKTAGPVQDPEPLPYLQHDGRNAFNIHLEAALKTPDMSHPQVITKTNARYLYWSPAQQIAHHASNGCNLRVGDLIASGTISGPDPESYGSLLETTWKGTRPIQLPSGEERTFLRDGDTLSLSGYSKGDGYTIGFGEVSGTILPATIDERLIVER